MNRILENMKPTPRMALNVGGGLDLVTGVFMKGKYGEDILIGWLWMLVVAVLVGLIIAALLKYLRS